MTRSAASSRLAVRNFPYSLSFDAANDFVDMGNNYAFERTDAFSLGGFFSVGIQPASNYRLHSKTSAAGTNGYAINIQSDNKLYFYLQNSAGNRIIVNADTVIRLGVPYFYCATYDGSSTAGGVNIALMPIGMSLTAFTSTTTTANTLTLSIVNANNFRLGARVDGNLSFSGLMQKMFVATTALSLSQVQAIYYNNKFPASTASIWLGENTNGSGATVSDEVGSITGTITGATWSTTSYFKNRTAATTRNSAVARSAA